MAIGSRKGKFVIFGVFGFLVAFLGTFFGVQFATKTGVFFVPGEIYYGEEMGEAERGMVATIFGDEVVLSEDVQISVSHSLEWPELSDGEFLYDIMVPVTNFYSSMAGISSEEAWRVFSAEDDDSLQENADFGAENSNFSFISVKNLDFKHKVLEIDGNYYFNDFRAGAIFSKIKFQSEKYKEEILPLLAGVFEENWPSKETVLSLAQTGVTALSRGMKAKLDKVGDAGFFATEIKEYLSGFDLTHTSNEASFTDFASAKNICSDKRFKETLLLIGLDIVELTGNHNQDCGDVAAVETLDFYEEGGIATVGGGRTAEEAAEALEIDAKGTKITMFAYNLSTGGATYDNTPGANQYYEERAAKEISEAKARGDLVIVDVQYYECNAYASEYEDATCDRADSAAGDQVGFFRHLIDLGADVVVGTSAHQPQTFELYGDGAIYYGLGNLFFDQVWWPGTTRSLVLEHYFYEGKLLQTRIVPTVYGADMVTKLLDEETKKWFIERLAAARP